MELGMYGLLGCVLGATVFVTAMGGPGQTKKVATSKNAAPKVEKIGPSSALQVAATALPPIADAATVAQIREYLRLSGDMDSFRERWITAVDQNRGIGAPYWPESFWTDFKAQMQAVDLQPMFVTFYQHGISRQLMQEVLDTYHTLGVDHFKGSPACAKWGDAELTMSADMDKLKLAKTSDVANAVFEKHKAEIKAARTRYLFDHPDYRD